MSLARTFVGFSSTDINYYRLMTAWKANTNIDFNFVDCQLQTSINSENEVYIKKLCRERIGMASKFIQLIGQDTKHKYKYVRWEAEVAMEKGCIIIGVNLNGSRKMEQDTCPPILRDIGAIFIPFSPYIIKYSIENYSMNSKGWFYYEDEIYKGLGYE
ncbi:hypothetical protein QW71_32590 [Paenibacillus sp. IHB B 3415]|uniref:TIR domain-containing protein n=1 Tax=Paenibacillus sp. IHB B 3415 TaxID=867080 RepID=UPI000575A921|nr:TIR domain-containing protein [Paenibacillus sp. IHB B 3415]KHL91838.1 hypothetical protein QW71_32590 [Paenibacillus sp. IHB B 3415]